MSARWTDEGLNNVTDPTPDEEGCLPPGSSVGIVVLLWAAVVAIVLAFAAVDRVWHATVTPHNEQRVQ